jgi:flagellin-like protein
MAKYLNVYTNRIARKRGKMTIRSIFEYKRGVSPLIATILLLAFSVALATVIIQLAPFSQCKGDEVLLDSSLSCYSNETKTLKILVETKEIPVAGFRINVKGSNAPNAIAPEFSKTQDIKAASQGVITMPYDSVLYGEIMQVKVVTQLNRTNNLMDCELAQKIQQVKPCQS